eukprot:TRINITY_DN7071_c0_g1_i1.p1 TRINITY_DN7071_c0_g1~~TRINITY_DN7071_c0_g1_i1.p1  ORF type:complete len:1039 (+),score=220.61 TRINITY_DN7071_c0_g1_i1:196-3312(+)
MQRVPRLLLSQKRLSRWRRLLQQNTLVTVPVLQQRNYSTSLQSTPTPGSSSGAALLFGQTSGGSSLVRQAGAILARVQLGKASTRQLVEALTQLAPLSRDATDAEVQELAQSQAFCNLLSEIGRHLPRDAGEKVIWEPEWTTKVTSALRDLQVQGVESKVCHRLGNALLQAAPHLSLTELLQAACDLSAIDSKGMAPDDYTLWVVAGQLEDLCEKAELGALSPEQLVPLIHLLAHPAICHRVAARASPAVLRHVQHNLAKCQAPELAKLLQAYADVPAIVNDVLRAMLSNAASSGGDLKLSLNLPELTVVSSALPAKGTAEHSVAEDVPERLAMAVLGRLLELVTADAAFDMDLAVTSALSASASLPEDAGRDALTNVLGKLGAHVTPSTAATLSMEMHVRLLLLAVRAHRRSSPKAAAPWVQEVVEQISRRAGELPALILAGLVKELALSEMPLPASLFESLSVAAVAVAPNFSFDNVCTVAEALAQAGVLEPSFLEAADVEACFSGARRLEPSGAARLAWAMATVGLDSDVAWSLLGSRLDSQRSELASLSGSERLLLLEALSARAALHGEAWPNGSTAAQVLSDSSWLASWREQEGPASPQQPKVIELLQELGLKCEEGVRSRDGLYSIAIFLPEKDTVIDLIANPRHPASQRPRGGVTLRHQVWSASGYSVLAIPDSVWERIAPSTDSDSGEANSPRDEVQRKKREWLSGKLESLVREDTLQNAGVPVELAEMLDGIEVGDKGINRDGLQRLAKLPLRNQKSAIETFKESIKRTSVNNQTAWLIGIINKEQKGIEKETSQKSSKNDAAGPEKKTEREVRPKEVEAARRRKPTAGWEHTKGRPLQEVKRGDLLEGVVTNVYHERVWVDAGLVKDVTFMAKKATIYKIGEKVKNLKVIAVNVDKKWVEVTVSNMATKRKQEGAAKEKRPQTPKAEPKASEGSEPKPASWKEAASPRPSAGWTHQGGKSLSQLTVGSIVEGKVTNVYRNRVWVNIGAEKDASFYSEEEFNIGDIVKNMKISGVELDSGLVSIRPNEE